MNVAEIVATLKGNAQPFIDEIKRAKASIKEMMDQAKRDMQQFGAGLGKDPKAGLDQLKSQFTSTMAEFRKAAKDAQAAAKEMTVEMGNAAKVAKTIDPASTLRSTKKAFEDVTGVVRLYAREMDGVQKQQMAALKATEQGIANMMRTRAAMIASGSYGQMPRLDPRDAQRMQGGQNFNIGNLGIPPRVSGPVGMYPAGAAGWGPMQVYGSYQYDWSNSRGYTNTPRLGGGLRVSGDVGRYPSGATGYGAMVPYSAGAGGSWQDLLNHMSGGGTGLGFNPTTNARDPNALRNMLKNFPQEAWPGVLQSLGFSKKEAAGAIAQVMGAPSANVNPPPTATSFAGSPDFRRQPLGGISYGATSIPFPGSRFASYSTSGGGTPFSPGFYSTGMFQGGGAMVPAGFWDSYQTQARSIPFPGAVSSSMPYPYVGNRGVAAGSINDYAASILGGGSGRGMDPADKFYQRLPRTRQEAVGDAAILQGGKEHGTSTNVNRGVFQEMRDGGKSYSEAKAAMKELGMSIPFGDTQVGQTLKTGMKGFQAGLSAIGSTAKTVGSKIVSSFQSVGSALNPITPILDVFHSRFLKIAIVAGAVGFAVREVFKGFQSAMDYQDAVTSFGVMARSPEKGKSLVDQIQMMGVATPFHSKDLMEAGRTLHGFGVETEDIIPTLKALGEATSAAGGGFERLQRLALAYGQVTAKGFLKGEELRQFANAGLDIKSIAEAAGVSIEKLMRMMRLNQVGADVLSKALNNLTGSGGRFEGVMEKLSMNARGRFQFITENFDLGMQKFGLKFFAGMEKAGIFDKLEGWTEQFKKFAEGEDLSWLTDKMALGLKVVETAAHDVWGIIKTIIDGFKSIGSGIADLMGAAAGSDTLVTTKNIAAVIASIPAMFREAINAGQAFFFSLRAGWSDLRAEIFTLLANLAGGPLGERLGFEKGTKITRPATDAEKAERDVIARRVGLSRAPDHIRNMPVTDYAGGDAEAFRKIAEEAKASKAGWGAKAKEKSDLIGTFVGDAWRRFFGPDSAPGASPAARDFLKGIGPISGGTHPLGIYRDFPLKIEKEFEGHGIGGFKADPTMEYDRIMHEIKGTMVGMATIDPKTMRGPMRRAGLMEGDPRRKGIEMIPAEGPPSGGVPFLDKASGSAYLLKLLTGPLHQLDQTMNMLPSANMKGSAAAQDSINRANQMQVTLLERMVLALDLIKQETEANVKASGDIAIAVKELGLKLEGGEIK